MYIYLAQHAQQRFPFDWTLPDKKPNFLYTKFVILEGFPIDVV